MTIVRSAKLADALGIATVHVKTWQTAYKGILPQDYLDNLKVEARLERWSKILSLGVAGEQNIVAEQDGKIIGFASTGANRRKEFSFEGEVYAIYVLKEQQGIGAGRLLFERSLQCLQADGFKSMMLWVIEANPTVGFYEKMGGKFIASELDDVGGVKVKERCYGWETI